MPDASKRRTNRTMIGKTMIRHLKKTFVLNTKEELKLQFMMVHQITGNVYELNSGKLSDYGLNASTGK